MFISTIRESDWAWLLHQVRPELPGPMIRSLAIFYQHAQTAPGLAWTAEVLAEALRCAAWESQSAMLSFFIEAAPLIPTQPEGSPLHEAQLWDMPHIAGHLRETWRQIDKLAAPPREVSPAAFNAAVAHVKPDRVRDVRWLWRVFMRREGTSPDNLFPIRAALRDFEARSFWGVGGWPI